MTNAFDSLQSWLTTQISPTYSRENYDRFLKDHPFMFTIPFIHITGTNGKGSTASFLATIYQKQGYRVGLYISPYFKNFTEMIRINGTMMPPSFALSFFETWKPVFESYTLTAFEMQTLCMFAYFQSSQCDLAVIEVGMGGRIDATNVFSPLVAVITSIGLEHTEYLGNTLASIASHKADIIKDHTKVVTGVLPFEANEIVHQKIKATKSTLVPTVQAEVITNHPLRFRLNNLEINRPYSPVYQAMNASVAYTVVQSLQSIFFVSEEAILKGLEAMEVEGRFQTIHLSPRILVDGGHNPEAIETLQRSMRVYADKKISILFASFKDKDIKSMIRILETMSTDLSFTTFTHPRARQKEHYTEFKHLFIEDYKTWISNWKDTHDENCVLLITGSLAFIGTCLSL
jgi:dihydrofolate synthase/folylpolyglutamate synthase